MHLREGRLRVRLGFGEFLMESSDVEGFDIWKVLVVGKELGVWSG